MNQNIIILVLLTLAILVSFYSAYLALSSSRKINKLQNEIKNSLGLINESLNTNNNIQQPENNPTIIPPENNPNKEEYPSLEELDKFNGNLTPLTDNLKEELEHFELDSLDKKN